MIVFLDDKLVPEALDSYIILPSNKYGVAVEGGRSIVDFLTNAPVNQYSVSVTLGSEDVYVDVVIFENKNPIIFRRFR